MMFAELIAANNIDRKEAVFRAETRYASDDINIYSSPEVVIVKNDAGRTLFNELAKEVILEEMSDDFASLAEELRRALK